MEYSDKRLKPTFLLCFFLGIFGAHRFYVGKYRTGLLSLFTLGGLGVWQAVDSIYILAGEFKDAQGRLVKGAAQHPQ